MKRSAYCIAQFYLTLLPTMNSTHIFNTRAVQIARRVFLRKFAAETTLALNPMIFEQGEGFIVLFKYGVIVFFNIPPLDQQHIIDHTLVPYLHEPLTGGEEECVEVVIQAGVEERMTGEKISLREASIPRLQLVAEVIARSVLLSTYEGRFNSTFDTVEPLAEKLISNKSPRGTHKLLEAIGNSLITEHDMVGRAAVTEKPDLLWEHVSLEGLYLMLENEYELQERESALSRKIELVSRTANTSLELLHARRSLRVEWYIVILIVVEIGLTLFELFIWH